MRPWSIYYRGSLSSCNYACGYCPFAKTKNSREELRQDQREVERFVAWVRAQKQANISLLFTPWGEALGHRYYRRALIDLSWTPSVGRVCIQTNLSTSVKDFVGACAETLILWATFHPGEVSMSRFLANCRELDKLGIRYSVGIVGLKEHHEAMEGLRRALHPQTYLWVNAYKRVPDYYSTEDLARIRSVDPHFDWNLKHYASAGLPCSAGETHFTIDGHGDVRRCHFVGDILTNIYQGDLEGALRPRLCPVETCGCYIGYIHRPDLALEEVYGEDLLGRIPTEWPLGLASKGGATRSKTC